MGRDSKKIYKCLKIEQSGKVTYTKQLSLPIPADKENGYIYFFYTSKWKAHLVSLLQRR